MRAIEEAETFDCCGVAPGREERSCCLYRCGRVISAGGVLLNEGQSDASDVVAVYRRMASLMSLDRPRVDASEVGQAYSFSVRVHERSVEVESRRTGLVFVDCLICTVSRPDALEALSILSWHPPCLSIEAFYRGRPSSHQHSLALNFRRNVC